MVWNNPYVLSLGFCASESWGGVSGSFVQGLTGLNQGQPVGCDLF